MVATILLVEDDKDLRDTVRVILMSSGYRVVEAGHCDIACSLLESERFDLVLLDITLPDRSGFRVLEFLREKHIPSKVIIITGREGPENAVKGAALGALDYVTKPYDPHYLLKSIERVLSDRAQPNFKLQIIKAGDFIKSTPTGDLDMKASREGLAQIAATGTDLHDYTVLIDLRDIQSRLSTLNIYQLASELVQYGETFRRKTAVLARADKDLDQATFFENVAQSQGFNVRAFTVFEDAITWLSNITQLSGDPSHQLSTPLR